MLNVKPKQFGRMLTVRLPESLYKAVDDVLRHGGLSKSGFIRKILTEALRIAESEVISGDKDCGAGA